MFATDAIFNGESFSDHGTMICTFDSNEVAVSGGEVSFNVIKPTRSDQHTFYNASLDDVLQWEFSICKNPDMCAYGNDMYFDRYEESEIAKWLLQNDGYHRLQFDQEGYEDVYYNVYINMTPRHLCGKTIGFDLTVTADCAYGFSEIEDMTYSLSSSTPLEFNVYSDVNDYILPQLEIIGGVGDFYINNSSDTQQNISLNKATAFTNVSGTIKLDCKNEIVTGLNKPTYFNWYFPRLVDGKNVFTTNFNGSTLKIKISYSEPRRVIV